jgi:hypothetical protein
LEIGEFLARTALGGKTLVVTNKPVRCALTGEDERAALPISAKYRGADIAHFGNIRGSNEFEGHEIAIILGRDEPTVAAAEQRAMAIWYDTKEPIRQITPDVRGRINYRSRTRGYRLHDGSTKRVNVSVHPDPRVQAVVEQGREAEMIQAIDRLRLIHNKKRKTVYVLCNIPLDLPVDELVTWKQLAEDRRLSDALAKCDERGWDALPLAAKEMSRLFPNLWATKKAAKRWLENTRPDELVQGSGAARCRSGGGAGGGVGAPRRGHSGEGPRRVGLVAHHLHPVAKMRSSKFDPRRQPRRPLSRHGVALRNRIVAGLILAAVLIFLALVTGGIFR